MFCLPTSLLFYLPVAFYFLIYFSSPWTTWMKTIRLLGFSRDLKTSRNPPLSQSKAFVEVRSVEYYSRVAKTPSRSPSKAFVEAHSVDHSRSMWQPPMPPFTCLLNLVVSNIVGAHGNNMLLHTTHSYVFIASFWGIL